jgi:type IV pilus assembly protein PilV
MNVQKRRGGFTLIEVLIAVVIFAIAYLALTAMQVRALRDNYHAYLRSQASALAYDFADRVRANPVAAQAGNYTGAGAVVAACYTTAGCSPVQMSSNDLAAWQAEVARLLPGGSATITFAPATVPPAAAAPARYILTITWRESDDSTQSFATTFEP